MFSCDEWEENDQEISMSYSGKKKDIGPYWHYKNKTMKIQDINFFPNCLNF